MQLSRTSLNLNKTSIINNHTRLFLLLSLIVGVLVLVVTVIWYLSDDASSLSAHQASGPPLTVATTKNNNIIFEKDELKHGFGYDVLRDYGQHLGVETNLKIYDDEDALSADLLAGKVDMAIMANANEQFISQSIACHDDAHAAFSHHGIHALNFAFVKDDKQLQTQAQEFLCNDAQQSRMMNLAKFYNQKLLKDAYNKHHFTKAVQKIPLYEYAFKVNARQYNHDWRLLAMVAYQESHLKSDAISPTGVQGLMMLTQETATAMGIKDRTDAFQSVEGGAKYLRKLHDDFAHINAADRLWFVLAAYNMGPNAVLQIQENLRQQGQDENRWSNVYHYLVQHADTNSRYRQCITYVGNIRAYLEEMYMLPT